jgi:2-dehydropantoate 2-reductase
LAALQDLAAVAPPEIPIVCVQNAVENERLAIRYFENVYGICVMCPTAYVIPGVVQAWCDPITGLLDIGRYPSGVDEAASAIASALSASKFQSVPRTDIMRWKYGKLLMNLGNAHEAICGPAARSSGVTAMARKEAIACFRAAGIAFADDAEDKARRGDLLRVGTIEGRTRQGGSSWQSLQRQTLNVETDYFNGEIVLLGHLHGIPTPVNALLQRLSSQFAREGTLPGSLTSDQVIALLPANVQRELSANR